MLLINILYLVNFSHCSFNITPKNVNTNGCLFSVKSLYLELLYTFHGTIFYHYTKCHREENKNRIMTKEKIRLLKFIHYIKACRT